jgi:hypothetical protein
MNDVVLLAPTCGRTSNHVADCLSITDTRIYWSGDRRTIHRSIGQPTGVVKPNLCGGKRIFTCRISARRVNLIRVHLVPKRSARTARGLTAGRDEQDDPWCHGQPLAVTTKG